MVRRRGLEPWYRKLHILVWNRVRCGEPAALLPPPPPPPPPINTSSRPSPSWPGMIEMYTEFNKLSRRTLAIEVNLERHWMQQFHNRLPWTYNDSIKIYFPEYCICWIELIDYKWQNTKHTVILMKSIKTRDHDKKNNRDKRKQPGRKWRHQNVRKRWKKWN